MDKLELEIIMERHQGEIYRYLRYLGADGDEAEDITQETFFAAYKSRTFPDDNNPKRIAGWLRGTARNLLYLLFRHKTRNREMIDNAILEQAEQLWTSQFLREGDGFEYVEALRQCVEGLPPKQRGAIDMRYEKKLSRVDMATAMRMTADGV